MVYGHFIDNQWVLSGAENSTVNPGTGQDVASFHHGNEAVLEQAISAARQCFEKTDWRAKARQRAQMLLELADAIRNKHHELALMLAHENGKVITQAHHEVQAAINECVYYAGLARNIFGRTAEYDTGQQSLFTREPIGVAAIIVPWNAPATLLIRSLAPAIAAGCTSIIKPAAETSGTHGMLMGCLALCPSLERGAVVSVNDGGIEMSQALVSHEEIDVISYTGSTFTGKKIMEAAAGTLKRLSLELGGKSPAVIFEDADIDLAVAEITQAVTPHTGQMCTAIGRAIIHESRADEFTMKIVAALDAIKIGQADDKSSQMGPLINAEAARRFESNVSEGAEAGEMLLKGQILGDNQFPTACFVSPAVMKLQQLDHRLIQQELFAPFLNIETFSAPEEAIERANATRYGLSASVYSEGLRTAKSAARAIKAGTVWLNCHNRLMVEAETGGFRESGLGRLHGLEGLVPFMETKHIYSQTEAW